MKQLLFSILFCLLFLVGCGKPKAPEPTGLSINLIESTEAAATEEDPAQTTEVPETAEIAPSTETPTTEPEPTTPSQAPSLPQPQKVEHPSTGYGLYDALIEKCIWCSLHTSMGDDIDTAILDPIIFQLGNSGLSRYYTIKDIDNDGSKELFIYDCWGDDSPIFAGYSIDNGQLVWFLKGGPRCRYYLCSDGKIALEGSSGAAYSIWETYSYKNGSLNLIDCYFTDDQRVEEHYWYYSQKKAYDPDAIMVSKEAFHAAVASMEQAYMHLDGLTLQDYMAQDEQAIRSDAALAAYREGQLHGKEKYQLWDTVLNRLWRILKYRLSSEEMKQLTQEQLAWIDQKETAAQNTNSEDGFEIQAAYTKERVSELLMYLNN